VAKAVLKPQIRRVIVIAYPSIGGLARKSVAVGVASRNQLSGLG
jgi:hypothetical protein